MKDDDPNNAESYFINMLEEVRAKLAHLDEDSPIKCSFPQSRLDAIREKIEASNSGALEWGRWQPPFLFLRNSDDAAIRSFDDDLRFVKSRSATNNRKTFEFLEIDSEDTQPWVGGVFEIYVKSALLRSAEASKASLDWKLANGRRPDLKIDLDGRSICIECTSLGESRASYERWSQHAGSLQADHDAAFGECLDAYTQSRRLYAKVFDKIAPQFDADRGQLNTEGTNLLLISLNAVTSDLSARSPAVGWALDELFASQPNGNQTPASLCQWLLHQLHTAQQPKSSLDDLLKALSRVSGIIVFDGCRLGAARINYNAEAVHTITHDEMAIFERLLSVPPLYAQ